MGARTSRNLQFAFALIYSFFLVSGAVPSSWLPKKWQPGITDFYNFQFYSLRIMPGMGVFNFQEDFHQFQPMGGCLKVDVETSDGQIKTPEDYPCPRQKPAYTFFQDPSRNFFLILTFFGVYWSEKPPAANIYARAIAEYYCRKYRGQKADVQFTIYYQDLLNRAVMSQPSPRLPIDCADLRSLP